MKFKAEILCRFSGAMLGLAVGDAMGVPLEFMNSDSFHPVNDIIGEDPSIWSRECGPTTPV